MKDILCKPPSNAAFSSQVVTDGSAVLQGNCSGTSLLSRRATTKHNCSRRSGMGAFLQANCPVGSSGLVPSELPIRERHETHVAFEWRSLISSLATFQQHDSVIWWRYRSGGNSFLERIRQVPWDESSQAHALKALWTWRHSNREGGEGGEKEEEDKKRYDSWSCSQACQKIQEGNHESHENFLPDEERQGDCQSLLHHLSQQC